MTSTFTKSRRSLGPAYCAWLALAAASGATEKTKPSCCWEESKARAIARPVDTSWLQDESADTCAVTKLAAEEKVMLMLSNAGYKATRQGKTEDGSMLFQFLGSAKACVDVYPTGEVVVIARHGEIDEVHQFEVSEGTEILDLLANVFSPPVST